MVDIIITVLLCFASVSAVPENVTVVTSIGTIIGFKNDGYNTFFGIPYASVNEANPFGSNLKYMDFKEPFIANDNTVICPQVISRMGGQLQCLRLNIYVPHEASQDNTVPILVWIHGGGFVFGSGNDYGGQHLAKQGIIVVTINYRLGPYGFFCLNNDSVPGNQGLKDQITALRWVKDHIGAFGGDPTKVTIAGQSYGGGSVDLHLYSKYEALFDKAIIQSGSVFTPGFYGNRDHKAAVKLALNLGYKVSGTEEALKVLAKENPITVMRALRNTNMKLTPCKETRFKKVQHFVTKCVNHLNNPDRIEKIKILIGYNSKEDFSTFANKPQVFYDSVLGDIFYRNLQNNFVFNRNCELEKLSDIIRTFYMGSKQIGPESMLELVDYSSDFKLNYAVEKSVSRYMEQGGNVYKYMFSYIGGSPFSNMTGAGAIHTEELKYLFETAYTLNTEEHKLIRNRMVAMWANFVKFGNPTPQQTDLVPITWLPLTEKTRPYLNIDVNLTMNDYAYRERIAFWDLFMQKYDKRSY